MKNIKAKTNNCLYNYAIFLCPSKARICISINNFHGVFLCPMICKERGSLVLLMLVELLNVTVFVLIISFTQ